MSLNDIYINRNKKQDNESRFTADLHKHTFLKILNSCKRRAYEYGKENKILLSRDYIRDFRGGHFAEFGLVAMLSRIEEFYKSNYNVKFDMAFDYVKDSKKTDIVLMGKSFNIKSKFSDQHLNESSCDPQTIIYVNYDQPGMCNLLKALLKIKQVHFIPDNLVADVNYIWESYMSISAMRVNKEINITYCNFMGHELDKFSIYKNEMDNEIINIINKEESIYKSNEAKKFIESSNSVNEKNASNKNTKKQKRTKNDKNKKSEGNCNKNFDLSDYPDLILSKSDMSRILNIDENDVEGFVTSNKIRNFKIKGQIIISKTSFLEFINDNL